MFLDRFCKVVSIQDNLQKLPENWLYMYKLVPGIRTIFIAVLEIHIWENRIKFLFR